MLVVMPSGVVSMRLTPEPKWSGNSMVECLPEEQMVAGSSPARSTETVRTTRYGE